MGGATMSIVSEAALLDTLTTTPLMRFLVTQGVLRAFPKEKLPQLLRLLDVTYIRENSVILRPSDLQSASLLVVVRGEVELLTERYPLRHVGEGDWFGGEALLGERSGVTGVSGGECVCLCVSERGGDEEVAGE